MGLKVIITSHSTFFNCSAGMEYRWHPEIRAKQPCHLPYGKDDGNALQWCKYGLPPCEHMMAPVLLT